MPLPAEMDQPRTSGGRRSSCAILPCEKLLDPDSLEVPAVLLQLFLFALFFLAVLPLLKGALGSLHFRRFQDPARSYYIII